jgi:HAMP domain-containing protein
VSGGTTTRDAPLQVRGWLARLSFRHRIVALLVLALLAAQAGTFLVVSLATDRSVDARIEGDLQVGQRVWEQFHAARGGQLLDSVTLLAADFGFKEAVASADRLTMASALANHSNRLGADLALLLAPDGAFLADRSRAPLEPHIRRFDALLAAAQRDGNAAGVIALHDRAFHVAVVPMLAPTQIAWVVVGVDFGADVATQYQGLTGLDVSFLRVDGAATTALASTLAADAASALESLPASVARHAIASGPVSGGSMWPWRSLRVSLANADPAVVVVLLASREAAMAPFAQLRTRILALSALATLLATALAGMIGRSVSRPVADLVGAAARIEQGDYTVPVPIRGNDELARLASVFNRMQSGIAQREERIVHQAGHD